MSGFMELYDLKKLILVVTTCYKNCDVLLTTKSKLDSSFRSANFNILDYCSTYRIDRNPHGGEIFNIY